MISENDQQFVLELARKAIEQFVTTGHRYTLTPSVVPPDLLAERACFVTLTKDFELRGCIGHLEASQPLYADVIDNAIAAATQDDRFNPVSADELATIDIEVSVLTPPSEVQYTSPEDLLAQLRVGVDGVILEKGNASATFLPQVWDEMLDKKEFLAALSVKAGLAPGEWMESGVHVYTYQVEIIS